VAVLKAGARRREVGEKIQWIFARRLSDASYDCSREIAGSLKVTANLSPDKYCEMVSGP